MRFDTAQISPKRIAIVWLIIGVLLGTVTVGPCIYVVHFVSSPEEDNPEGPIVYFGLHPPSPPQWSADGTNILLSPGSTMLVETGDIGVEIETMKDVVHPNIFPEGTRIAFATLRHGDNYEIGVSNLDGSKYRRLTKTRSSEANPVWSPDGTQIAFIFNRLAGKNFDDEGPTGLYIMNSDGSNVRRLAPQVHGIGSQAWSPDGQALAFLSLETPPSGSYEDIRFYVYTVGRDGSNLTRLGESARVPPAWSPDGIAIAFMSKDGPSLLAINPDGSGLWEIAAIDSDSFPSWSPRQTWHLSWSPDSSEILLQKYPFILAKADGSSYGVFKGPQGMTQAYAAWSPNGVRIAVDVQTPSVPTPESDGSVKLFTMARDGSDKRILAKSRGGSGPLAVPNKPWDIDAGWIWYDAQGKPVSNAQ